MIRVTLTKVLEEWWGAEEAMEAGGIPMVLALLNEDPISLLEGMDWHIEHLIPKAGST